MVAVPCRRRLLIVFAVAMPCAGCTDLMLRKWRDDAAIDAYHYELGEQYLEVGGIRYCYQEFGRGETVVIFPGLGSSIDFWWQNIPVFAERYHVLAVDAPGFAKSDKPDGSYEITWIADRLNEFLDAKGVRRCTIIGQSMGGQLALVMAIRHSEKVEKLVLMGSVGNWPPPGPLLAGGIRLFWNDDLVIDHLRRCWPDILCKIVTHDSPKRQAIMKYQMALRANLERYRAEGRDSSRTLKSILLTSCRPQLPDIRIPVLLVWGAKDTIHGPANGREFRALLPDSRLVIVADAGHGVNFDQPAWFNRVVLAFLADGTAAIRDDPDAQGAALDAPTD